MQETESESHGFSAEDFTEYLNSPDYRQDQIKKLIENQRLIKQLQQDSIRIASTITDSEKRNKLTEAVSAVHLCVLEQDGDLESVIKSSLDLTDQLFLSENRNSKFFKSGEIFDEHKDHPVQKRLVRGKHMNKRLIKKSKTPMDHLKKVHSAKSSYLRDKEIEYIKEEIKVMKAKQAVTESRLDGIEAFTAFLGIEATVARQRVQELSISVNSQEKLKLCMLLESEQKYTQKNLAEILGVSTITVKRWSKELRALLAEMNT